jgi:hypothetical protein
VELTLFLGFVLIVSKEFPTYSCRCRDRFARALKELARC